MAGDPFGRGGSSSGGGTDPFGRGGSSAKKPGGILGDVEKAAHWTAKKAELAARDVKNIPGGVIDLGKGLATHPIRTGEQVVKSTVQTVEHPLRDPFMTALTLGGLVSGVGSVAGRAAAISDALEEGGSVAKAAMRTPAAKPRLLDVGGDTPVALHPSKNPAVRAAQGVYDKKLEKAVRENPEGKLAAHANRRAGGSLSESARYRQRIREAPANTLEAAGRRIGKGSEVPAKLSQAALRLTSEQSTAEEAARYHYDQAAKGLSPERNTKQAKIYEEVGRRGLVHVDESRPAGERVHINAAKYPRLAALDEKVAHGQSEVDRIAAEHGIRSPEELQARVDAPGRFREGAVYEAPTAAKAGLPSQALIRQRAYVDRLQTVYDRAEQRVMSDKSNPNHSNYLLGPAYGGTESPILVRLGGGLSVAKEELQRMEDGAARRVKPTGIVGGTTARPGRGFVSYKTVEQKASKSNVSAARGPVIGAVKPFIANKTFTGHGLEHGLVPDNTTRLVAQHMRDAYKYVNSDEYRKDVIDASGSDTRRSSRDVLARIPGEKADKITAELDAELGRKHITTDELAGHEAAHAAFMQQIIPGLRDKFSTDKAQPIGSKAPAGYKWVDQGALGDLAKLPAGSRGRIARSADNINSAVTAATVYFKIGHVGTRVLTNAATNIIQGSAKPADIAKSVELWKQLSPLDRQRALAAAGQHGFDAMPHEGTSIASKVAGKGANWWAKHADAPFRFNSIAYEARKAGFDTPAKFKELLDKLENPHDHNMNAAEAAKVDWVAKRSNREGIAYDRLSEVERRYITRAVWFYPWVRGTAGFAYNTLTEHPFKATALGIAGQEGRRAQQKELGDLPSYEAGLFKIAGGSRPLVADFSTFSPFATPADLANAFARPAELSGMLNPVYGAGNMLINGQNQFGGKSQHPVTDALASLLATTPEAQVATAYLNRHEDQSKRMFKTSPLSALLRTLVGPGMPRRINPDAAHSSAARERAGR